MFDKPLLRASKIHSHSMPCTTTTKLKKKNSNFFLCAEWRREICGKTHSRHSFFSAAQTPPQAQHVHTARFEPEDVSPRVDRACMEYSFCEMDVHCWDSGLSWCSGCCAGLVCHKWPHIFTPSVGPSLSLAFQIGLLPTSMARIRSLLYSLVGCATDGKLVLGSQPELHVGLK